MEIIINIDDYGISRGVNLAVIEAHKLGVVMTTTALVASPFINHGVELAEQYPNLQVGIHLALDIFKSYSKLDTLSDQNNNLFRGPNYPLDREIAYDDLYLEWDLQIKEFIKLFGYPPKHIDSHHHAHMHSKVTIEVVEDLAKKYNIQVRGLNNNYFSDSFYDENATLDNLKNSILECIDKDYNNYEFMAHIAFLDNDLINTTSYSHKRMDEFDILTSNEFLEFLNKNKISISHYK